MLYALQLYLRGTDVTGNARNVCYMTSKFASKAENAACDRLEHVCLKCIPAWPSSWETWAPPVASPDALLSAAGSEAPTHRMQSDIVKGIVSRPIF